jgi:sortase (surface protein transpeptidase)
VLAIVGSGCLALGFVVQHHPLGPASSSLGHQTAARPGTAQAGSKGFPRSAPASLHIPSLNLTTQLSELGVNDDGTVQVPTDIQEAGWYKGGPAPGQSGSAVILGHVDSYAGPAVFFDLRSLTPGDQILVTLTDGTVTHFTVTAVDTYVKTSFPAHRVYGDHHYAALQLVTCGGTFDAQTGSYLSNVVVYSTLSKVT